MRTSGRSKGEQGDPKEKGRERRESDSASDLVGSLDGSSRSGAVRGRRDGGGGGDARVGVRDLLLVDLGLLGSSEVGLVDVAGRGVDGRELLSVLSSPGGGPPGGDSSVVELEGRREVSEGKCENKGEGGGRTYNVDLVNRETLGLGHDKEDEGEREGDRSGPDEADEGPEVGAVGVGDEGDDERDDPVGKEWKEGPGQYIRYQTWKIGPSTHVLMPQLEAVASVTHLGASREGKDSAATTQARGPQVAAKAAIKTQEKAMRTLPATASPSLVRPTTPTTICPMNMTAAP